MHLKKSELLKEITLEPSYLSLVQLFYLRNRRNNFDLKSRPRKRELQNTNKYLGGNKLRAFQYGKVGILDDVM